MFQNLPMPVIRSTYSIFVFTDACVVLKDREIFAGALCVKFERVTNGEVLTPVEFKAVNWGSVKFHRYIGGEYDGLLLIDLPACDLGEHKVGVRKIRMQQIQGDPFFSKMVGIIPRIKWLAYYTQLKERRTALAMAFHCRLGGDCLIRQLDNEIMQHITSFDI